MKLCKNCRTINNDSATSCIRCKMKDQLVSYNPEKTENWKKSMNEHNAVKRASNVCKNCGTSEYGDSKRCRVCNFPLTVKKSLE